MIGRAVAEEEVEGVARRGRKSETGIGVAGLPDQSVVALAEGIANLALDRRQHHFGSAPAGWRGKRSRAHERCTGQTGGEEWKGDAGSGHAMT